MIALTLLTRVCAALRRIGPAFKASFARSGLRASSAMWRVMEGGSAGV
ncbi:hypothetical protein OU995_16545 [Roseateles sp. SL47]|nr:hypothetical protein [Roseateles sp. SL47]WAC71200.1 hypothetical protein OU995_16545 [Roseateles sp. SL47]